VDQARNAVDAIDRAALSDTPREPTVTVNDGPVVVVGEGLPALMLSDTHEEGEG
jgi:hypothetical protein